MKRFYVDLVRGAKIALLAGPFASEAIARKYELQAFNLACELDPWAAFDSVGVISIPAEGKAKPGILNAKLEFEPGDLLEGELA